MDFERSVHADGACALASGGSPHDRRLSTASTGQLTSMHNSTPNIIIGVWTTGRHQRLDDTIRAIYETAGSFSGLIILDDIQEPSGEADHAARLETIKIAKPGGGAASLNQLLSFDADIYVMIEAGAIPAPDWLAQMIGAINADPSIGAVGPSTNICWNEQAIVECRTSNLSMLSTCAAELAQRFGNRFVTLSPTYNLADFAFAVTRRMVETIGLADERYLDGPCWEMDYWARAALAGLQTVWAQSAFVWRDRDTIAGARSGPSALDAGKRLYQSHFCSQRRSKTLATQTACTHCYGSACSAFVRAPIEAFAPHMPHRAVNAGSATAELPLISCVMPTRGRREFVAQSVRYFLRQDYPNRELVIVYESPDDLPENLENDAIKLIQTSETSIGGKREVGALASSGEILVHWDDDDWFASNRLSRQAAPILANVCDISGLTGTLFFALTEQRFWAVTPTLFAGLFVESVQGGTLMFRRDVWKQGGSYPRISLREDVALMTNGMKCGARLARVSGRDLSVYLRHGRNSWAFTEGEYLDPEGWHAAGPPQAMREDLEFYAGITTDIGHEAGLPSRFRVARTVASSGPLLPLLSCIMPTNNRHRFVPAAIEQFLRQDYQHRELIIIDDGTASVEHLVPDHPMIRYYSLASRRTLGEKRNMACELASGDHIVHWDDDDWIAPTWLSAQIECLLQTGADIVGINQPLFHDPVAGKSWRYVYDGSTPWAAGGTFCYRRDFWARYRFASINIGEDNMFLMRSPDKKLAINPRHDLYVARVHGGNSSPKHTSGARWQPLTSAAMLSTIDQHIRAALANPPA